MIKFEKVNKSFGTLQVLKNFSIHIKKGEVVVVIGSSGCGKSTFLRCINKLEKVDSGKVVVDNIDITSKGIDINKIRAEVGIVFQQFNLFPHMTVLENIMLAPLKVRKLSKIQAEKIAEELLIKVDILEKAHFYPDQLSGGQQQRVAIARSLAMYPKIMLFDEPTSALDPQMTNEVLDVIKQLANDGMTMVVVTHEMGFAKDIADRIVFINSGSIIEQGPPSQIFENPTDPQTINFLRTILKLQKVVNENIKVEK